jgi:hypothetical protein
MLPTTLNFNCDLSKPAKTSLCAAAVGRMGWPCASVEHVLVRRRPVSHAGLLGLLPMRREHRCMW